MQVVFALTLCHGHKKKEVKKKKQPSTNQTYGTNKGQSQIGNVFTISQN